MSRDESLALHLELDLATGQVDAAAMRDIVESIPGGVTIFGPDLEMVVCNTAFRRLLDFPDWMFEDGLPSFEDLVRYNAARGEYGADDLEAKVQAVLAKAREPVPHVHERSRPNGTVLEIRGTPLAHGGFATIYIDITERQAAARQAEDAMRRANSLFEDAIAYSPTYIYEVDADGRFTFIKGSDKVLGYSSAELFGRRFGELRCRDMACREHRNTLDSAFRTRQPYEQVLTCAVHKDGTHLWLSASGHPMVDASGVFTGYRGVGFDVTETTNSRKELERMALMDPLTGLANRRKFMDRFKLEVQRQDRHGQPLAMLVVDVDHFKLVNDQFGHLTGDLCLKCVADLLALAVRKIDLVARFGGEEFIVLLPETTAAGAVTVAEKLRATVESLNVPLDSRFEPLSVTVSVGVAMKPATQSLSFDDVMEIADQGLYQAKRGGRNRVAGPPDAG